MSLDKYKNVIVWCALVSLLLIFTFPILELLLLSFNLRLLLLVTILALFSMAGCQYFLNNSLTREVLITLLSLIFTLLFFISDSAQRELSTISLLKGITTYNCDVVSSIQKTVSINEFTFSYFDIHSNIDNLGGIYEQYGKIVGDSMRTVTNDMVYSNRILDALSSLYLSNNISLENAERVKSLKAQLLGFADEINKIMSCSENPDHYFSISSISRPENNSSQRLFR